MSAAERPRDNPWIADLAWAREATQDRGRRTQVRLLDALERLLADAHLEDLSVGAIVAEADSSVGAFYHHFGDKQTLVQALLERAAHEFRRTCADAVDPQRWRDATILDILRGYLEFALDVGAARRGVLVAEQALARRDPTTRERLRAKDRLLNEGLAALLLARRDEIGHPDPTRATHHLLTQLRAALSHRLQAPVSTHACEPESDATFVDETLRMAAAYLTLPERGPEAP